MNEENMINWADVIMTVAEVYYAWTGPMKIELGINNKNERRPRMSTGNEMADQILDFITSREGVSFAELEHHIKGFCGGAYELSFSKHNIVLWQGVTKEGVDALNLLLERKLIYKVPTSVLVYLIDGLTPELPIAKRAGPYKKPHWAPIVFNSCPDPASSPGSHSSEKSAL